jgi:hypothetical protein
MQARLSSEICQLFLTNKKLAIAAGVVIFRPVMKKFNQNHQFYDQAGSSFGALLRLLPCRAK